MRESEIESYLKKRVKEIGGEVRKVQWIGRRGAPDRLVMLPGRAALYVELKAPGKTVTIAQTREHNRLRAFGQQVEIVDSLAGVDLLLEQAQTSPRVKCKPCFEKRRRPKR